MVVMSRRLWLVLAVLSACSSEPRPAPPAPSTSTAQSPLSRTGIEGCNCAGAAPAMLAPDGAAYPFQSIVAYYYQVLQAFWTKVGDDDVLKTWLAASIEATGEEFYAWQAKSVQIFRDRDLLGFAHRYYRGIFGFLAGEPGGASEACAPALDPATRTTGMLAHVGLSQAGVCGTNDDGTTKFWQVNHIVLLMIGDVVDAYMLVDAGIAKVVETAPAALCILPAAGGPVAQPVISDGGTAVIPCRVAFTDDAVTEGIVLPVPTSAVVAGVPLIHRAFTAAGTVAMPNALDEVRKILRDGELRAMFAIGLPRFVPEPSAGPTQVRLVGHAIGPARQDNALLLPEERSWIDGTVGDYDDRCCHVECGVAGDGAHPVANLKSRAVRADAITHASSLPDAGTRDAGVHDAGVPDAGGSDAWVADAAVPPDAGMPFPDAGTFPFPDAATFPVPDAGTFPLPDAGTFPPFPDAGTFPFPDAGTHPLPDAPNPPPGHDASPPADAPTGPGTPDGGAPVCHTVCIAEGVCETGSASTGLVVMVSAKTTAECNGSCPEPAANAPEAQPTCEP